MAGKHLRRRRGRLSLGDALVEGYEIHSGVSRGEALDRPLVYLEQGNDGAISADGQIAGTYLHGLFDQPTAADALLGWAGLDTGKAPAVDFQALIEDGIDRLADSVAENLDLRLVYAAVGHGNVFAPL